jgi:hypothetical protein
MNFNSIWFHLASLSFTLIGFTSNITKVRLLIVCGNLLFITNSLVGWPFWPNIYRSSEPGVPFVDTVSWDTIAWATFNAGLNTCHLLYDLRYPNHQST